MPIGVSQFQIFTPEQANPLGYGLQQGIAARLAALQAQKAQTELPFVAPKEQQALQAAIYANMIQKPRAEGAVPLFQAELAKAQAEPGEIRARTGLYGQQATELAKKLQLHYLENEMAERTARTGLYGEQTKEAEYKRTHGGYDTAAQQTVNLLKQLDQQAQSQYAQSQNANPQQYLPQGAINQAASNALPSQPVNAGVPQNQPQPGLPGMTPQYPGDVMGQLQQTMQTGRAPMIHQSGFQPNDITQALQSLNQQQSPAIPIPQMPSAQTNPIDEQKVPGTDLTYKQLKQALIAKQFGISQTQESPSLVQFRKDQIEMQKKRIEQTDQRLKAADYDRLPVDEKAADAARLAPILGSYSQASHELRQGKSVEQIAKEHGYTKDNMPPASYPITKPNLTRNQQSNIARNAFDSIKPLLNEDLGKYPESVMGYSPRAIADHLRGKNDYDIGKAYAGIFMLNEKNGMILKTAGINVGLGMLQMAQDKSFIGGRFPKIFQNAEIMRGFNDRVEQYSNKIINSENLSLNRISALQNPIQYGTTETHRETANEREGYPRG